MTSAKKYGIQEFRTKLPDFLLQFVDANIRNDTYGALRSTHLSHKIDDLIPEQLQTPTAFWLFVDPTGNGHLIVNVEQFARISKASESLPKKDKQLQITTKQTYSSLEFEPKNILSTLLRQDQMNYLSKIQLISIDQIRLKCQANLYFEPEEIIKDITNLIAWNQFYRASSKRTFIHLSNFYGKFIQLIAKRKFISKFYQKKNKDFEELEKLQLQYKLSVSSWPWIPKKFREYENLEDYLPTPSNRKEIIEARLKSEKQPIECPENCVCYRQNLKNNEQFCSYSLADVWQSQCPNRKARIQCNHQDLEKANLCRNSEIKNKRRKTVKSSSLDEKSEIEEYMAWGMDLFTRNVILNCLPEIDIIEFNQSERNVEKKNEFIERSLQKSLNFLGEKGFDLGQACKFIIENGPIVQIVNNVQNKKHSWKQKNFQKIERNQSSINLFTSDDVEYAKTLLKNKLYADLQFPENEFFRIHTKGKGAKCIAKQGIKRGTFIVEYFGELYEPWRWYEREDFIKEVLKKKKLKQVIPEFYNIYLEKHKDEPLGYDMLVVDPIKKGNFSSRFSHSCTPNCGTVSTVSQGKYIIGMYSIKDISYGQELTFDYCSMTESQYEHTHSICLCGTKQCRGNYLQLANSKVYNNLMDSNSCFHYRNSLMLNALEKVTKEDREICETWNVKKGVLQKLPEWMVKWCSIILQSIQREAEVHKNQQIQSWTSSYPWPSSSQQSSEEKQEKIIFYAELSKNDLISLRFQNLMTTIDKIQYYLESIEDTEPPLRYEKKEKICQVLIENHSKDSILIQLQDELTNEKLKEQIEAIEIFLKEIRKIDDQILKLKEGSQDVQKNNLLNQKLFLFRLCCLCVSHMIIIKGKHSSNRYLLSDIIYFYAFTHTYFTPHEYKTHTSEEIKVTLQEILGQSCASKFSDKTKKRYTSPCVWGQMVSWFKQTIVNPEASLSQDRRGTLSYPLINSILKSTYPFQKHTRPSFLKSIRQKPASSWPPAPGCQLSYKNPYKCYGTLLFENVHKRETFKQLPKSSLLDSVLDVINESFEQKLNLFKQVEFLIEKIPQNSELYDILDKLNFKMDQKPVIQINEEGKKGNGKKKVKTEQKSIVNQAVQRSSEQDLEEKVLKKNRSRSRNKEVENQKNSQNIVPQDLQK